MPSLTESEWDVFLKNYPDAHILQSSHWAKLKSSFGWDPHWLIFDKTGVQVLFKKMPLMYSVGYIPKGPIGPNQPILWQEIDRLCYQKKAIFLKIEPDFWVEDNTFQRNKNSFHSILLPGDFKPSNNSVQPKKTLIIDLVGSETDLLGRMKQKTRYNIRLAIKKGVVIKPADDVSIFYRLMQTTGLRDGFEIHSLEYYKKARDLFKNNNECELLLAEYQGDILAGLMIFRRGNRAWYFYGASSDQHREVMAPYLLQWEAMVWARKFGCTSYDLWGVPDVTDDELEKDFMNRKEDMWGVYRFKRGFGGSLRRTQGTWDKVYKKLLYRIYLWYSAKRVGVYG